MELVIKQCEMLLLVLTLVDVSGEHDVFPKRVSDALERCCAHADGCDALDCRLYREFHDSYRYEALEAQCREPLLYALWPPHRARSVHFDCLAPDHFLARLQHDIRTSEAQATPNAKEVQFLCIVDPRAIAHPQYKDVERMLDNGTYVNEPCATTFLRGADADLLWRYLRAMAAPAAFSEIHVRAPRRHSGVRAPCADGSRSLLTLNAAEAVRRLLPELGRRQHATLRVLAHVHGVDARAHCVLCEYIDGGGVPRVKMKKFETSVSVYPYHRRVTEPQRRAPPWARRDRLRARDSLWCAGYRALLALHRPQIMLEGGVRYRPRRARRCHVLALGGARVIKLVLGDTAQLARVRLPAYALHVQLRWAAAPARWKPESVSVVRVGAASGTRRRLARARWLPRRRAFYARALTLRAPSGHYLTIDTLGVEYFEGGTPERFSRSIDGKLDTDGDLKEVNWAEVDKAESEKQHYYHIRQEDHHLPITPMRTTLLRTDKSSTETVNVSILSTYKTNVEIPSICATIKENKLVEETKDANIEKSSIVTKVSTSNIFTTIKNNKMTTQTIKQQVNNPCVQITNVDKSVTLKIDVDESSIRTKNATEIIDTNRLSEQTLSPQIATPNTQTTDAHKSTQITSPETTCVQVTHTAMTTLPVSSKSVANGYINVSNVQLTANGSKNPKSDKPNNIIWKIVLIIGGIVLVVVLAGVCMVCLARYGMFPCYGQRHGKETDPAEAIAGAAATTATRAEGETGGPLDVVVQTLVVAQGVTIALAARMLWHLWHASHGATAVPTGT